jgi:hypothetical protein
VEELRAHEREEFVVTKGEAGNDAEVFKCIADRECDQGENNDAAKAVVLRAVHEREGEGGEDFKCDDGSGRGAEGKDLEDAGEGVEGEEGGESAGDCASSLLSGGTGCGERSFWHRAFRRRATAGPSIPYGRSG